MKTRILHVGKYFPPYAGGMENFIGDLLPALNQYGVETGALVHADPRKKNSSFKVGYHAGIPVWPVPCYREILYAPISPSFPRFFSKVIAEFKPDIIHYHMPNTSAFWGLFLKQAKQIPWVVHWHADVVPSKIDLRLALAYKFYRPFEQRLLANAKKIIVTSPNYLTSSNPLRQWKEKCETIPLGIAPGRMNVEAKKTKNLWRESPSFKVLAIGRLTYYKGHETLIKAASLVDNIEVKIVGKGEQQKKLAGLIRSQGLENKVKLAGYKSDQELHAMLAGSDCLCLPSVERTEAFGLVLLEAMCYGKPVIACDVPGSGMGWVVDDHETGILVPPADAAKLAGAIRHMANNKNEAVTMGKKGLAKYREKFTMDRVAEKIGQIYHTVAPLIS